MSGYNSESLYDRDLLTRTSWVDARVAHQQIEKVKFTTSRVVLSETGERGGRETYTTRDDTIVALTLHAQGQTPYCRSDLHNCNSFNAYLV